jgi:hypothetical protein
MDPEKAEQRMCTAVFLLGVGMTLAGAFMHVAGKQALADMGLRRSEERHRVPATVCWKKPATAQCTPQERSALRAEFATFGSWAGLGGIMAGLAFAYTAWLTGEMIERDKKPPGLTKRP